MKVLRPIIAVLLLIVVGGLLGMSHGTQMLAGVFLPGVAFLVFIVGFIRKVLDWSKSPVPFKIPTTCGQAKSLDFIKADRFDCPDSKSDVIVRMFLEVFLFRSLFRNTKAEIHDGPKITYGPNLWLWLFGILFHYSFLTVVIRHMRLFTEPVLPGLAFLEYMDGFVQIGAPVLYQSDLIFLGCVTALFVRRLIAPQVKYISLGSDYFPLALIFAIGTTGMLMRHLFRVDVVAIKQLTMNLVTFNWFATVPADIHPVFFIHVVLVSTLMMYFPFSKLMHMGGIFFSPTRNMTNDTRAVRHINPWNDPSIKPHSYAGYEDEFREFMVEADIPVDKPLPPKAEEPAEEAKED